MENSSIIGLSIVIIYTYSWIVFLAFVYFHFKLKELKRNLHSSIDKDKLREGIIKDNIVRDIEYIKKRLDKEFK